MKIFNSPVLSAALTMHTESTRGKHFLPGNIIPHDWYDRFHDEDGRTDFVAISILSDVVAWCRNGTNDYYGVDAPKFDGRSLLLSYDYFKQKMGLSNQRVRRALIRLEEKGVLKKTVVNVKLATGTGVNRLCITLNFEFFESCFRDAEFDIRVDKHILHGVNRGAAVSNNINIMPSYHQQTDHLSKKKYIKKNRSIKSDSNESGSNILKIHFKEKQLIDFYPLSQTDASDLQYSSGRQFSVNAMNEILKDMSKRLADPLFKSKKAFMSYMSKAYANEMRDAVKISNESFRIKSKQSEKEITTRAQEEYLDSIENSLQTSPEWRLKKKLASVFEPSKSYNLLKTYKSINKVRETFYLHLSKHVELTDLDKKIILNQIKATHENIDFKDEKLGFINEFQIIMPARKDSNSNKTNRKEYEPWLPTNVWGTVRSKLIDLLYQGKWIDKNWFSKLEARIDEETKELKLKAPTSFIRDWITQNYQHLIESVCTRENYRLAEVTI